MTSSERPKRSPQTARGVKQIMRLNWFVRVESGLLKDSEHESDLSSGMEPKVVSRKSRRPEEVVWLNKPWWRCSRRCASCELRLASQFLFLLLSPAGDAALKASICLRENW